MEEDSVDVEPDEDDEQKNIGYVLMARIQTTTHDQHLHWTSLGWSRSYFLLILGGTMTYSDPTYADANIRQYRKTADVDNVEGPLWEHEYNDDWNLTRMS